MIGRLYRIIKRRRQAREVFTAIYRGNEWGDPESVSGRGSTLARTVAIREALPDLLRRLKVRTLLDAPCGDLNWMRHVELPVERYIGADVVPELIRRNRDAFAGAGRSFIVADITRDRLPRADLVLCRDCFIHLSFEDIRRAYSNFRRSATYLLATTHTLVEVNTNIHSGQWRSVNLERKPFDFPKPLELLVEDVESGKSLGLWRLSDLP